MLLIAIETHRNKSIGPILRCGAAFGLKGNLFLLIDFYD
jgi:hypothetical protein